MNARRRRTPLAGASLRSLASFLAVSLACCAQPPRDQPPVAVRDSAGIRIAENAAPTSAESVWSIDTVAVLHIGQVVGAPESQLFGVGPLARLTDGTVVVAMASELRFFAGDGAWIRTVGRKGDGPGEYREIESLYRIRGDSLVVGDGGAARVTWLAPDGAFVRDRRIARESEALVKLAAVSEDGRLVTARRPRTRGQSADYRRDSLSFAIQSGQSAADDVPLAVLGDREWNVETHGRGSAFLLLPFSRQSLAAASGTRIYLSETDRAEIRAYAMDGVLTEISRLARGSQPVTPPLLDSLADYNHLKAKAEAAEHGYTLPERPASEYRESTRRVSRVPTLPTLDALLTDGEGNVWVRGYDPPWRAQVAASHWWVLWPDGTVRARITLPPGLDVRCIRGDMVLGTVMDELGVEYVEGYRLRRQKSR